MLQPLIDGGLAAIETAGSLRGGRDVWLLVRFNVADPRVREVFATEVVPFGLLSNNHAGERGVVLQETPIRVVCANTLGLALETAKRGRMVSVRHTLGVEERTTAAAGRLWRGIIERYRLVAEQYRLLRQCYLEVGEFRRLVLDVVSPMPDPRPAPSHAHRATEERVIERRERLHELWLHGAGHRGERSAWEAYNGAVEALDHDERLWRTRGSRAGSLMAGGLGALKQRVLDGLVQHARVVVGG